MAEIIMVLTRNRRESETTSVSTAGHSGIGTAAARRAHNHFLGNAGMSDPLHDDAAENAGRFHGEHEDHDDQRHGELLAVADDVDAGRLLDLVAGEGHHVLEHADDEAADHGA